MNKRIGRPFKLFPTENSSIGKDSVKKEKEEFPQISKNGSSVSKESPKTEEFCCSDCKYEAKIEALESKLSSLKAKVDEKIEKIEDSLFGTVDITEKTHLHHELREWEELKSSLEESE